MNEEWQPPKVFDGWFGRALNFIWALVIFAVMGYVIGIVVTAITEFFD